MRSGPKTAYWRGRRVFVVLLLVGAMLTALTAQPAAAEGNASIPEIQGDNHLSPLVGETVTTTGVVTAVAFRSFYLQDPVGDGNANTSDGILVVTGDPVAVGDEVEVTGQVVENIPGGPATGNLSITQLQSTSVSVLSSGNALPAPVEIGVRGLVPPAVDVISADEEPTNLQTDPANFDPENDGIDFYEALEGMYVEVDRPVAVSGTRQFNAFSSEVVVLPSRGRVAIPADARTKRGGILLQPDPANTGDQNPERLQIQFDGTIFPDAVPAIQVGDRLADVRGVMGYSFGNYEVNATEDFRITKKWNRAQFSNLRPFQNRLTVASYNVLNLSPDESDDAQRAKLASQIMKNLRSPDIIALQEIQDDSGEVDDGTTSAGATLQALVEAISAAGGPSYSAFDVAPADGASGGVPGGNIRNAFLYNPDRVGLVDYYSLTEAALGVLGSSNPAAFAGTRDPLVGVFSFNDATVTVINNHLTSRFGSTPIFGAIQPFVQAGEAEREAQVGALNEVVDGFLAGDPAANVLVLGDLNTFEWTNDLAEILPGDDGALTNMMDGFLLNQDTRNPYTFNFEGNSQALDHVFATKNLLDNAAKLDIVHTNVDFSRLVTDVTASDHEPLLARFKIRPAKAPRRFSLQLLHASDLEGGVQAIGRAANFAAIVDALEDREGIDASVTISAGDNYIPGPFFNASADRAAFRDSGLFNEIYNELFGVSGYAGLREASGRVDISIMNIIGFDASALGNHEFDSGSDALEQIIEEDFRGPGLGDDRWVGAQFPYLSSNLDFSGDADLGNLHTSSILANTRFKTGPLESASNLGSTPKLAPATFIELGKGERLGVVGATTPILATISSPGGTTVIGPDSNDMPALAAVIQPQVDALKAMGINKIVLTSHLQQLALEQELATLLNGVDIIIAGGSDSLLANEDDALRAGAEADEQYPVITADAAGDPTVIVSTDGEYSYVGQLSVDFNREGQLIAKDRRRLVDGLEDLDLTVNGPVKTEGDEVAALWGSEAAAVAAGTKANLVSRLVDAVQGVVIAKDGNVTGETTVFLDGRRESVRTEETNFGNLSADANLAAARQAEASVALSLKNGGGIRAAIGEVDANGVLLPPQTNPLSGKQEGQISELDIENSLRFNNGLTLLTLSAAELQAVIEHAVAATEPGATPGQFGQIGGARYRFDPSQAPGSRVLSLDLIDPDGNVTESVISGGELVSPASNYRIVTLDFLAGGGDSYPFPDLALASTDTVQLSDVLTDPGSFTFADPGSEQDALAEFLGAKHGIGAGTPFDQAETDPSLDQRIVDVTVTVS